MRPRQAVLASGTGWRVTEFLCALGPWDRPFEERHEAYTIAAVTAGCFTYRGASGEAVMVPGALLLGNHHACFECRHEHGVGDRCLAFHFEPTLFERIGKGVPGLRRLPFQRAQVPAGPHSLPLLAAAQAARATGRAAALEEIAVRLAGAALRWTSADPVVRGGKSVRQQDARRVTRAIRWLEANLDETLPLGELAGAAGMASPYHFLRLFRAVTGTTPHRYLVLQRLQRAAVRLRTERAPIAAIAFGAGFNDLSTFNNWFKRVIGTTPGAWRSGREGGGSATDPTPDSAGTRRRG